MANLKQIKVGNTTYNIEPYTNYLPLSDLGYKTFKVTRGASQSTNTSGYWAAMVNSSQAGSPTLPSSGKWWHVISMDWSGTDMNNWVSQLALPTQQGGVPHYRRNNADGTSIESSTWHAFVTDEHLICRDGNMPENASNLSETTVAHKITLYQNGISIPYQMDNANDGGILRCRGTTENSTILELGTWDDSGAGETIQFNYYPTTSQVTPTYSVTVPKKSGTIALTSDIEGHYLKWGGSAANTEAMGWGTLTSANGYSILSHASSSDGGDWGMVNKSGQIFMQLDGYYYQNEGQYRVLDTSDSSSFAAAGHTHSAATQSANGFMSSTDKKKLDEIAEGANKITVDSSFSSTSWNPVRNNVIYSEFGKIVDFDHDFYEYGDRGSWRLREHHNGANSLDIKYGKITINAQEKTYSVSFYKPFVSTNYAVVFGIYRGDRNSWFSSPLVRNRKSTGFDVYVRGNSALDNSGTLMYIAIRSN